MGDVNIREVPDAVIGRLREQAQAEGFSFSEWVRRSLTHQSELRTPAELARTRQAFAPVAQSAEEFAAYYHSRLHRQPR